MADIFLAKTDLKGISSGSAYSSQGLEILSGQAKENAVAQAEACNRSVL